MNDYCIETDIEKEGAKTKGEVKEQIQERLNEIYCQVGEAFYKENRDNPYLKANYTVFFRNKRETHTDE